MGAPESRRWPGGATLADVEEAKRKRTERIKLLTEKRNAPKLAVQPSPGELSSGGRAICEAPPPLPALEIRLYHHSEPDIVVRMAPAAQATANAVALAILHGRDGVVLSWPEKIGRPMACAIAGLIAAQAARPEGCSTVGWYPYQPSSVIGLKSLFLDEHDISQTYKRFLLSMPREQHGSAPYKHAYLLKALASAPVDRVQRGRQPISHPNLREMVGLFTPSLETTRGDPYAAADASFLADIGSKRTLIGVGPMLAEVRCVDRVPMAIFGLRQEEHKWTRDYKANIRLRDNCEVIVFDGTSIPFGETKDWVNRLKSMRQFLSTRRGRKPALVVLASDPWFARRAAEILSTGLPRADTVQVTAITKQRPVDFTSDGREPEWTDCAMRVHVRDAGIAAFRKQWVEQATFLRKQGLSEAADAIIAGITFLRNIACLPIGLSQFRDTHDRLQKEGVEAATLVDYTYSSFHARLMAAASGAGSFSQDLHRFRDALNKMANGYLEVTDIAILVRDVFARAARKSNRILAVFRDPVVLAAIEDWIASSRFPFDPERIGEKVILATPDTFAARLADAGPGAPVDTMLVIHPTARAVRRIVMWPSLPDHMEIVGDGGALGSLRSAFKEAEGLFQGPPGKRVSTIIEALNECEGDLTGFDFDQVVAPEFKGGLLIDLTVGGGTGTRGPVTEIATEDGYRLRLFQSSDCLVRQDNAITPFKRTEARTISPGNEILVVTADLYERLDAILGPVPIDGKTRDFLKIYHETVRSALAAIPGDAHTKANRILERMRVAAHQMGYPNHSFGLNERQNVMRWMKCGRVSGRPDAPRSGLTFKCWTKAIELPMDMVDIFWRFGVVNARVQAIQAGLQESNRSLEFVVHPEPFYRQYPALEQELRELREELSRRFSVVSAVTVVQSKT